MSLKYPVKKVHITQKWGVNGDVYSRFGFKGHNGVDFRIFDENGSRSTYGKSYAPHHGKVIEARLDANGYGWYVKIENDKEGSILAHHKVLHVEKGDKVKQGDLIGTTDNTGWSTGSHLHWGYFTKPRDRNNGYGGTINPIPIIEGNMLNDKCRKDRDAWWNGLTKVLKAVGIKLETDDHKKVAENVDKAVDKIKEVFRSEKECEMARDEMGKKIKEARQRIESLEEKIESQKASKAQYIGQVKRLKEKLAVKPTEKKNVDAKILKLIMYLSLSGGIGYVLSTYVAQDPELFKIITPVTNLILYVLEQRVKRLQAETGLIGTDTSGDK